MSFTLMELVASLTLDSSQFDTKMNGLTGSVQKSGSMLGTALKTFIGVKAVGALKNFAQSSIETGKTFDSAMSQVAATLGKTMDEVKADVGSIDTAYGTFTGNLRDFAQFMGTNTVFSATQAAEALNYMALAGYDTQKSMRMLPNVLNLASAGGMELARASDMVTDAASALGLKEAEVSGMIAQMAKTAQRSNTSVEQLGDAILTVGGTARYMAGGTDRLNTVLGILADNGIKGSEAGTHLRNMLMKLSNPTKEGEKWIKKLGVQIYDADGKMRDFAQIFPELNVAMSKLTDQDKMKALSEMFNARDVASVNALMGTSVKRWNELGNEILNAGDAAQQMSETQLDNLSGAMTLFQSALEGAKIAISDALTPALKDFVGFGAQAISTLTTAFKAGGLEGMTGQFADVISEGASMILQRVPEFVKGGAQIASALIKGLIQAFPTFVSSAGDIVKMVYDGIITGAPTLVAAAKDLVTQITLGIVHAMPEMTTTALNMISLLSDYIHYYLPQLIETGRDVLLVLGAGIANAIPTILEYAPKIITNLYEAFHEVAPALMEAGASFITRLAEGVQQAIPTLLETILPLILEYSNTLRGNVGELVSAGIDMLLALLQGLMDALPTLIDYVPEIISNVAGVINDNAPKILSAGVQIILTLIKGLIKAVPSLIANFGDILMMIWNIITAFNWLTLGGNIVSTITQGVKNLAANLPNALSEIAQQGWKIIKNIDWAGLGRALIDGIVQGIRWAGSAIGNTLMGYAEGAWKKVKSFFGIGSPSKLMRDTVGKWIPEGIAVGIEANADSVYDAMDDLSKMTVDSYDPEFGSFGEQKEATNATYVTGDITINIDAKDYDDDPYKIAQKIRDVLTNDIKREEMVFGV